MSYKALFVLYALVELILGAALLFVPEQALGFFGTETYVSTVFMTRFFGSAMVALGLVVWFAKDAGEGIQKGTGWVLFANSILGLFLSVIGVSSASGVIRSNGWIPIIVHVLFAMLYGFVIFLRPKNKGVGGVKNDLP